MTVNDRTIDFALLNAQVDSLLESEPDALANTANFVGLLFHALPEINWLGVYVLRDNDLVLGPFQGKPACVRIQLGEGVCGTAAASRKSLRVADVDSFPGHIACDPASRSELVIPLLAETRLLGVLDIDSATPARFAARDLHGIEQLCKNYVNHLQRGRTLSLPFI
jgi:GAF domain-containing protein